MSDLEYLKEMQEKINKAKVDLAVKTNELNKLEEELKKLCEGKDPEELKKRLVEQIKKDEEEFKKGMNILKNEIAI